MGHRSYTSFAMSNLEVSATDSGETVINVRVQVKNTGKVLGTEVVQVYCIDPVTQFVRPWKRLLGFQRVTLKPGASAIAEIDVAAAQLAMQDDSTLDGVWRVVPGEYTIRVGSSSVDDLLVEKVLVRFGTHINAPRRAADEAIARLERQLDEAKAVRAALRSTDYKSDDETADPREPGGSCLANIPFQPLTNILGGNMKIFSSPSAAACRAQCCQRNSDQHQQCGGFVWAAASKDARCPTAPTHGGCCYLKSPGCSLAEQDGGC